MHRHAAMPTGSAIVLDRTSPVALYQQLYRWFRTAILSGQLAAGARLPATRVLAAELGISRSTVISAFEQLLAEGYLAGVAGSGTYVADVLPDDLLHAAPQARLPAPTSGHEQKYAQRGSAIVAGLGALYRPSGPPASSWAFVLGIPAVAEFPHRLWGQLLYKRWHNLEARQLLAPALPGYPPLRRAIAEYVRAVRGVHCDEQQIIIVSGSQQAFTLLAQIILDPGDVVWMEEPGYHAARLAWAAAGAQVIPVPVDAEGLNMSVVAQANPSPRLMYVTPSHQFPLGVTLSLPRRLALLELAHRTGAWIVEDDYDSEYRYGGRPLPALQGLDTNGRVIYVGTFSKVLFPALRLAYVVVPPELVEACTGACFILGTRVPTLHQQVVCEFIVEGHFARHIRRMRKLYAARRQALLDAAPRVLGDLLDLQPAETGMHLLGWLAEGLDDRAAANAARRAGVNVEPLSAFRTMPGRHGLLLGYAAPDEPAIRAGVESLAEVLNSLRRT